MNYPGTVGFICKGVTGPVHSITSVSFSDLEQTVDKTLVKLTERSDTFLVFYQSVVKVMQFFLTLVNTFSINMVISNRNSIKFSYIIVSR